MKAFFTYNKTSDRFLIKIYVSCSDHFFLKRTQIYCQLKMFIYARIVSLLLIKQNMKNNVDIDGIAC